MYFRALGLLLVDFARTLLPSTASWLKRRKWLSTLLFFISLILAATMFLFGCSTPEPLNATAIYQHDLKVTVNGQVIKGMGVIPLSATYAVKVQPKGKIDRIIIRTCHRETVFDKPDKDFWDMFKKSDTLETNIVRDDRIENSAACAMEIDVFENKKNRSGWAVIDFLDARPEISLPMFLRCNGEAQWFDKGVGVCQAASGLTQEISFNEPVMAESGDCPGVLGTEVKTHWSLTMPQGKCTFYFAAKTKHQNGKRLKARLNTLGYTHIPPVN